MRLPCIINRLQIPPSAGDVSAITGFSAYFNANQRHAPLGGAEEWQFQRQAHESLRGFILSVEFCAMHKCNEVQLPGSFDFKHYIWLGHVACLPVKLCLDDIGPTLKLTRGERMRKGMKGKGKGMKNGIENDKA